MTASRKDGVGYPLTKTRGWQNTDWDFYECVFCTLYKQLMPRNFKNIIIIIACFTIINLHNKYFNSILMKECLTRFTKISTTWIIISNTKEHYDVTNCRYIEAIFNCRYIVRSFFFDISNFRIADISISEINCRLTALVLSTKDILIYNLLYTLKIHTVFLKTINDYNRD